MKANGNLSPKQKGNFQAHCFGERKEKRKKKKKPRLLWHHRSELQLAAGHERGPRRQRGQDTEGLWGLWQGGNLGEKPLLEQPREVGGLLNGVTALC